MDLQKQIEAAVAAGTAPLRAELDNAKRELAEIKAKPATDTVRSLVGLVPSYEGMGARQAEQARGGARAKQRDHGFYDRIAEKPAHVRSGLVIARWIRGIAIASQLDREARAGSGAKAMTLPEVFKSVIGDDRMAEIADVHTRTLQASVFDAGGAFIPDVLANDWIEFLRPFNAILSLNPTMVPLDKGNLSLPKQTTGVAASWEGENVAPAPVEQTTGLVRLAAREMKALIVVSQKLQRRGGPMVEQMIMTDLAKAVDGLFDSTAIRGTGLENSPSGLKSLMASGQKVTAYNSTTPTGVQVEASLEEMIGKVEDAENLLGGEGIMLPARVHRYLRQLRTTNGQPYFEGLRDDETGGTLLGYPCRKTNNIPANLGGGSNESEIYFGSFPELLVGMEEGAKIELIPNGALSVSGTVYSDAGTNTDVVKALQSVDFQIRHDTAFAMLQTVKWGA